MTSGDASGSFGNSLEGRANNIVTKKRDGLCKWDVGR